MKRHILSAALVACLVVLAASAGGCQFIAQKATEKAIQGATGGAVNVNGDQVTIKGQDGQATYSNDTKLPADFPSDVPIHEDGTINAVVTSTANGGKAYMVNIRYKIPQAELLDWYKTELEKGGWTVTSTVSTGDGGMVSADKGDLTVNAVTGNETQDGFTSIITLNVAPKTN
jgi:hypothetical protein